MRDTSRSHYCARCCFSTLLTAGGNPLRWSHNKDLCPCANENQVTRLAYGCMQIGGTWDEHLLTPDEKNNAARPCRSQV